MSPDLFTTAESEAAALPAAASWLAGLAGGEFGVILAVIAVAVLGFVLLSGRVALRRAGRTALSCFILFGAGALANALLGIVSGDAGTSQYSDVPVPAPAALPERTLPDTNSVPRSNPFDPYGRSAPAN